MAVLKTIGLCELGSLTGTKFGVSNWKLITQELIDRFASITKEDFPIHSDPVWSRDHSPFGKTIAQGFLTASLLVHLFRDVLNVDHNTYDYALNYGYDKLRMVSPVPVNSRIRGHFNSLDFHERRPGEFVQKIGVEIEIEDQKKPALIAEWLFLFILSKT